MRIDDDRLSIVAWWRDRPEDVERVAERVARFLHGLEAFVPWVRGWRTGDLPRGPERDLGGDAAGLAEEMRMSRPVDGVSWGVGGWAVSGDGTKQVGFGVNAEGPEPFAIAMPSYMSVSFPNEANGDPLSIVPLVDLICEAFEVDSLEVTGARIFPPAEPWLELRLVEPTDRPVAAAVRCGWLVDVRAKLA